jgi:hypothetical protein
MKKAHRLMIPLLVVISISALLGASVLAKKEHRIHPLFDEDEVCHCFMHEPENCERLWSEDPDDWTCCGKPFDPLCCHGCTGWCLGAHLGTRRGNRPLPD